MKSRIGTIRVAATSRGVCKIALGKETAQDFFGWLERHIGHAPRRPERSGIVALALDQIAEYLDGHRREFDLPLDLRGTEFQRRVWSAVAASRTDRRARMPRSRERSANRWPCARSARPMARTPCRSSCRAIASSAPMAVSPAMAVGWM